MQFYAAVVPISPSVISPALFFRAPGYVVYNLRDCLGTAILEKIHTMGLCHQREERQKEPVWIGRLLCRNILLVQDIVEQSSWTPKRAQLDPGMAEVHANRRPNSTVRRSGVGEMFRAKVRAVRRTRCTVEFEMREYAVCGVGIYFLGTESLTHRDIDRVRGHILPLFPPSPFPLPR